MCVVLAVGNERQRAGAAAALHVDGCKIHA
jgi:hypothetical protein